MELPLLQSKSRVPPHSTQLHPRLNKRNHNLNPNPNYTLKNKLIIVSVALFSLLLFLSAALRLRLSKPITANRYGIVIYVSMTRTECHVFTSLEYGSGSVKTGPGFGSDGIKKVVVGMAEFAKGLVPRGERGKTKVRVLGEGDGEEERGLEEVFGVFRRVLRGSGFLFEDNWVGLLEDKQKAVYNWVAANYALGNLGKEPERANGIVNLGGTSMQITVPSLDPEIVSNSQSIKLAGVTYNLFTDTWPYFGQNAMRKSLGQMYDSKDVQTFISSGGNFAKDACVPKRYKSTINATDEIAGNFSLCTSHVRALFKRKQGKNCLQPPCEIVLSPSIKLRGIMPVPFDKVFFISEFFGLVPKASLSELDAAGHHFCDDNWYKLKLRYDNIDDLDLGKYCFSSAFVVAMLHDNFGISMTEKRIGFATPGKDVSPTWIYGAFILQILQEPLELERGNMEEIVGNDLVTYISLLTVLLIAVLGAVFLLKCQKPQLKTVYDLQKGHYIVTRLPR